MPRFLCRAMVTVLCSLANGVPSSGTDFLNYATFCFLRIPNLRDARLGLGGAFSGGFILSTSDITSSKGSGMAGSIFSSAGQLVSLGPFFMPLAPLSPAALAAFL